MKRTKAQQTSDQQQYPGVSVDVANNEKVNQKLTKEYTRSLNNNPRNEGE